MGSIRYPSHFSALTTSSLSSRVESGKSTVQVNMLLGFKDQ